MSAFATRGRAVAHVGGSYLPDINKRAQQFGKQFAKKTRPVQTKGCGVLPLDVPSCAVVR